MVGAGRFPQVAREDIRYAARCPHAEEREQAWSCCPSPRAGDMKQNNISNLGLKCSKKIQDSLRSAPPCPADLLLWYSRPAFLASIKVRGRPRKGTAGARAAHISLVPSCPAAPLPSYRPTRPARAVPPESSSAYAATATRGASTMASLALL